MRIVIALGGNALLRRGQPMTADNQRANVRVAAEAMAPLAADHELVISHGNGPQVGLLALQGAAYPAVETYPLDVLGAQTEGMIGYLIEQELGNLLPSDKPFATVLTMVEVDPDDPAFANPEKFIGPVYEQEEADRLAASPLPRRVFEIRPIRWLLEYGAVVICTGGGGIPTMYRPGTHMLEGAEVVVDKDRASSLLARDLDADLFVMATDVDGVYRDWGKPSQKRIDRATSSELSGSEFAAGSMGPKVGAAVEYAERTGHRAAIGTLADVEGLVAGTHGTSVVRG